MSGLLSIEENSLRFRTFSGDKILMMFIDNAVICSFSTKLKTYEKIELMEVTINGCAMEVQSIVNNKVKGIQLRILLAWIFGSAGLLLTLLLVNSIQSKQMATQLAQAQMRRMVSFQLADELRQSSDDLTRMARTYVVTGDEKYERFFKRILAIRNGLAPRPKGYEGIYWDLITADIEPKSSTLASSKLLSLESRMMQAGFTVDEFALLKNSQNQSDALVSLENVAMHAIKGEFDDGTGTFSQKKTPNREMAIQWVHGNQYHEAKARIMKPLQEFFQKVNARTKRETDMLQAQMASRVLLNLIFSAALLCVLITGYLCVLRWVLRPVQKLAAAVDQVGKGEYTVVDPLGGARELTMLVQAFNHMSTALQQREQETKEAIDNLAVKAAALEREKGRAEKLLLNVLPVAIADRLQRGEEVQAETFPEVTVFFADIVGFTKLASQVGPRSVAMLLNELFEIFDNLVHKHQLEKIKTIGDSYMAVAGVPDRSPTHAQQMADFALEVIENLREQNRLMSRDVQIRIGIHSGTVTAGIIGRQKFAYDLWGDVVNVTSRLESTAEPMMIHASESVFSRLEGDYLFEPRGEVELKNRGKLRTYYLVGKKQDRD